MNLDPWWKDADIELFRSRIYAMKFEEVAELHGEIKATVSNIGMAVANPGIVRDRGPDWAKRARYALSKMVEKKKIVNGWMTAQTGKERGDKTAAFAADIRSALDALNEGDDRVALRLTIEGLFRRFVDFLDEKEPRDV